METMTGLRVRVYLDGDVLMQNAVVDRFEGKYAVVLIGDVSIQVLRTALPKSVREGDHLQIELDGETVTRVERDEQATQEARQRIQDKLDRLRRGEHLRDGDANSFKVFLTISSQLLPRRLYLADSGDLASSAEPLEAVGQCSPFGVHLATLYR
jgi:hypothetical protein